MSLQRAAPARDRVERLLPALQDRYKAVRIAAARTLLGTPVAELPPRHDEALRKSQHEWLSSLLAKADFPETHVVLGGTALVLRNPGAAEKAFQEAVRQDPQLADAWRMIVSIRTALGDRKRATRAANEAVRLNPENKMLQSIRKQLD